MARPDQVELTIELVSGSPTSRVTVRYRAVFDNADVAGNRRSQETIQLFGEDPPAGPVGDGLRFTFPAVTIRPNGQPERTFTRTAEVANGVLNEDLGGEEDEIYALVCLESLDSDEEQVCTPSLIVFA